MMIKIKDEKECCGCRACEEVCPKQCITMKRGTLGHLFPSVNEDECVSCNQCTKVCPTQDKTLCGCESDRFYVAFSKDKEIRNVSSSGGLFYSLASYFCEKDNYWIFGSCFNQQTQLKTVGTNNKNNIPLLCKSKYVQSDTTGVFSTIKQLLEGGDGVLYCATPCQIAALRLFLKKDYNKLFLIDFFCHGVPSQEYFDKCKELVETRDNIRITGYSFRTKKSRGVTPHYYTVRYIKKGQNKERTDFYYNSPFYAAFQSYMNLRESCYNCIFSNRTRFSDVTIGDFHEVEKYKSNINRFDGVSLVVVNTKKGDLALSDISNSLFIEPIDKKRLITDGVVFAGGTTRPSRRDEFIADYESIPFFEFNNKWFNKRKFDKQRLYYHLPLFLRKVIKRIKGI